jgi:hypothetical protein
VEILEQGAKQVMDKNDIAMLVRFNFWANERIWPLAPIFPQISLHAQ